MTFWSLAALAGLLGSTGAAVDTAVHRDDKCNSNIIEIMNDCRGTDYLERDLPDGACVQHNLALSRCMFVACAKACTKLRMLRDIPA